MARERYLVGVSQEELEYKLSPLTPKTPKGKVANIWYHYKWHILVGVFAVFVLTVLIVQAVTKEKPDYEICMATTSYIPEAIVEKMEEKLAAAGTDLNGDGTVLVSIQALNVQTEKDTNQVALTNRQAVIARIASGDVLLFAFSPEYYESMAANFAEGYTFFESLNAQNDAISEDGRSFSWDLVKLAQEEWPEYSAEEIAELLPTDVMMGVRAIDDGAKDDKKEMQQQCLDLLRKYLSDIAAAE